MTTPSTPIPTDITRLQDRLAQAYGVLGVIAQADGAHHQDQENALWTVRSLLEECRTIADRLPGAE